MTRSDRNSGKPWTPTDVRNLRQLAKGNAPTGVIGLELGRTESVVRAKAQELDLSLKPTNQSSYDGRIRSK